jgi:hypothetical protein
LGSAAYSVDARSLKSAHGLQSSTVDRLEHAIVSSISQHNPVRIFVAHAFEESEDYLRVFEYLESSHNFYYRNCTVPDRKYLADAEAARTELRRQIGIAEVTVIPAGLYQSNRDWVDFELNYAKGLDKPVIVLEFFGVKQKLPVQLEALSDEIIEWNERSIADAIRRQARHEETARWDVIDFKPD